MYYLVQEFKSSRVSRTCVTGEDFRNAVARPGIESRTLPIQEECSYASELPGHTANTTQFCYTCAHFPKNIVVKNNTLILSNFQYQLIPVCIINCIIYCTRRNVCMCLLSPFALEHYSRVYSLAYSPIPPIFVSRKTLFASINFRFITVTRKIAQVKQK